MFFNYNTTFRRLDSVSVYRWNLLSCVRRYILIVGECILLLYAINKI
jgi:hypothetical protein